MSQTLQLTLLKADSERLAALAKREGVTPEALAAAAVRARLDEEAKSAAQVEAGLAELDAGQGMTIEDFEREMDGFMGSLAAQRG